MKKISVLSILFLFLTSISIAGTVNLPRTGQTRCWDTAGVEIPCAGTGQDGEIQAGVAWPVPRFTDNGDGTMTDNLTGLMWTKNGPVTNGTKSWNDAVDYCNNLTLGGYDDWRLPNVNELESLVNANEAINVDWLTDQGFTNVPAYYCWSSTTYAEYTSACIVDMYDGYVVHSQKSNSYYVWPIRGGESTKAPAPLWKTGQTISYHTGDDGNLQKGVAWPSPRFTDNGNTITDNLTGLMWTKNANLPNDGITWQQALDYVARMNGGTYPNYGYYDWRLPNRKELHSLTDYSRYNPALPTGHPFTNLQAYYYWSSTTYARTTVHAWRVDMYSGYVEYLYFKSDNYYLWPVRSGQCTTWSDVIAKYNLYVSVQAQWSDVINCYNQYATP